MANNIMKDGANKCNNLMCVYKYYLFVHIHNLVFSYINITLYLYKDMNIYAQNGFVYTYQSHHNIETLKYN